MKKNQNATSIIEAMVVLLVIVTGIVGVYKLLDSSQKLSTATENRIEAIQIARDGLEIMTNIRDTNWLLFGADTRNCWNVQNYNPSCVGSSTLTHDMKLTLNEGMILRKNASNQFISTIINHAGVNTYSDSTYRTNFQVQKTIGSGSGFYTQGGGASFLPLYTREIQLEYFETNGILGIDSNDEKVKVTAIVQWSDGASAPSKKLEMSTILTNWKK